MTGIGPVLSFNKAVAITKSDTVDIVGPKPLTDAVFVGATGVVVAIFQDGTAVNFTAAVGEILPISVKRINSGSTTADLMVALYAI